MTLKLNGSSSGYTAIDAPAAAGSNTLTLPTSNGSANQYLKNSGTPGALEFGTLSTGYTLLTDNQGVGTGTSYTVTSIPAANHIKVVMMHVSYNNNSQQCVRIGNSSGIKTADYFSAAVVTNTSSDNTSTTDRWQNYGANEAGNSYSSMMDIWRAGTSNNYYMHWVSTSSQSTGNGSTGARIHWATGFVDAGGTIDRLQIYGESSGNLDSGSISIYYI